MTFDRAQHSLAGHSSGVTNILMMVDMKLWVVDRKDGWKQFQFKFSMEFVGLHSTQRSGLAHRVITDTHTHDQTIDS